MKRSRMKPIRSSRYRWKWMISSAAATGAIALPSAMADRVQVTLQNNQASLDDGNIVNNLNPDITGDGFTDLFGLRIETTSYDSRPGPNARAKFRISLLRNGGGTAGPWLGSASYVDIHHPTAPTQYYGVSQGNGGGYPITSDTRQDITFFKETIIRDSRIAAGFDRYGWVHIRAYNTSPTNHTIQLLRTVFDPQGILVGVPDAGATYPEFVPTDTGNARLVIAQKAKLNRKIKKLDKKIKKLKKDGNSAKASKLSKKLKKLKKQLKAL